MALSVKVNTACTLSGSSMEPRSRFGETNISPATNGSYGRYPDDGIHAFRNDRFEPHRSPKDSSPDIRNASKRSPNCMGRANYGYRSDPPLYRGPSAHTHDPSDAIQEPQDGYRRPNVEGLNYVGRPTYGYPSDVPTYRNPNRHLHMPGVPQLERNASRTPTYEWRNPHYVLAWGFRYVLKDGRGAAQSSKGVTGKP